LDGDEGQNIEISLNGILIKPYRMPMTIWRTNPIWSPYTEITSWTNDQTLQHRAWLAFSLPADSVSSQMMIELRFTPRSEPLQGSYQDSPSVLIGPSLDPQYNGTSFWRWLWNTTDPRIPATQPLNGEYSSSYFDPVTSQWMSDDLSPLPGKQTGLYHVMIVEAPFGATSDRLVKPDDLIAPN
jgi:hypothetical protein